jgi:hypothetical protein
MAEEEKVHVRFVKAYVVKDKTGTAYQEGEEHSMPERSAAHFIRKGVAVKVGEDKPAAAKTLVKAAPVKPEGEAAPAMLAPPVAEPDKPSKPDALSKEDIKKAK